MASGGERLFIAASGLKGAVPILLAAFAVLERAPDAARVYSIVFIVVIISVIGQGSAISWLAGRLGVPMDVVESEPWDISIRLGEEPSGIHRFTVSPASLAAGTPIRDLPISEHCWITFVLHDGAPIRPRGAYTLSAGDELIILAAPEADHALAELFTNQTNNRTSRPMAKPRTDRRSAGSGRRGTVRSCPVAGRRDPDVTVLSGVTAISNGGSHSYALTSAGASECWGYKVSAPSRGAATPCCCAA